MATRSGTTTSSREMMTAGFVLMLIAVGAGVSSAGDFALLLSFAGVLAGAILIFAGVRKVAADDPTAQIGRPGVLVASGVRVRALVRCLRRNLAVVGLLLASSAATATVESETNAVLCFCGFALLLLGLSLLNNIGLLLLPVGDEQEL